uniref:Putative HNH endonuclease n=1 Tax=Stauridium tetras TaxID=271398 RepID=A0A2U8GJV1_9CHLO|nr:putative HNH endonuclease [Stauridium tetras]AWI68957.1 putative HNH endonuclease [Stauridium tetras]
MKLHKKKLKFKNNRIKLESTFEFDLQQAKGSDKIDYYKTQTLYMRMYNEIEKQKIKVATPKWEYVSGLLEYYKNLGESEWKSPTGKILLGLYNKNKQAALDETKVSNTNLMSIISKPEMLLLAYKTIKGNKGALTKGGEMSKGEWNKLTEEQRELYLNSLSFPDKFNMKDILLTSKLIKKGLYPWGCSQRVYVPKPGVKDKKRPITIPPFLDRVVQKAISLILQAIYEPEFELLNRSFGFRPNKGTHDAIIACTSTYTSGKVTAVEGDIEAAYDTVNKEKLLEILSRKIVDRKFLQLIRERLNYTYSERQEKGKIIRLNPEKGIPQGGIDSPYLFNIYMNELDKYIHKDIQEYIDDLNKKRTPKKKYVNKEKYESSKLQDRILTKQRKIKRELKKLLSTDKNQSLVEEKKKELYKFIKEKRIEKKRSLNIKTDNPQKKNLKIFYVRYADDWILLTNGDKQIAEKIKDMIAEFLISKLELKLSEKKTFITDITKTPAKFLGFQLRHPARGPIIRKPLKNPNQYRTKNLQRKQGSTIIWADIDKQRLINRMHMKGFCNKKGFPKEKPWLSCMEDQVIVDRYNACMRGLAEFYMPIIRNKANIQRWIYILRFSCLKTLAQKYRTSIGGIYKKFGVKRNLKNQQTIKVTIRLKINENIMEKSWILLTYKELKKIMTNKIKIKEVKERIQNFWNIEHNKKIGEYPLKEGRIPTVTNEDFLNKISWVSLRTQASLDMPCASCGAMESQQHHVRHIRKSTYALIEEGVPIKKVMALRNRKQIPLCPKCH